MRLPYNGSRPVSCDYNCHLRKGGMVAKFAGIDVPMKVGTPMYAIESGTVRTFKDSGGGLATVLRSSDGKREWDYAHLNNWVRRSGTVKEGELIAYSGNTGYSTGPHLHYALRINGATTDPMKLIKPPKLPPPPFKMGDKIQLSVDTHLRKGHGVNFESYGIVKKGALGEIINNEVRYGNGYTWMGVKFGQKGLRKSDGWMITSPMTKYKVKPPKLPTDPKPPAPQPPPSPCTERLKATERLLEESIKSIRDKEKEITILKNDLIELEKAWQIKLVDQNTQIEKKYTGRIEELMKGLERKDRRIEDCIKEREELKKGSKGLFRVILSEIQRRFTSK